MSAPATIHIWVDILQDAYGIFDDLARRGFGRPPFSLGGGTVLMLRFKHRLSRDIDLFGYDARWLSLVTPRLNEHTAALAIDYVEQANTVKIVMAKGDIDFIVAADVIRAPARTTVELGGRSIDVDPPSEILAKKLFYRASTLKARDVYDLSAAIDLAPESVHEAVQACAPKKAILLQRLITMTGLTDDEVLADIQPYDGPLRHGHGMVRKVIDFIAAAGG